jgi:hypothetical protein
MVKEILEALMREEWEIYLEQHPTKANGSSTRDLPTRVGSGEDLKVPPYGKAISPRDPPLPEEGLLGTFRGHPRSLRCRGKPPEDLRVFGEDLQLPGTLKYLPPDPRTSESPAGKAPK